ncbi:MAG TPA: hypothetical protein VE934_06690 [Polaromonas sp.]|uniref:hypothetical protein n=1 Tax=Polaromonas sp. TaxID=1869339 RepID=UPI002D752D12|nr:hypothetical protein [Polaromonas sp.]HYW56627.1 hypothetical protein [Polaromonas sp.]
MKTPHLLVLALVALSLSGCATQRDPHAGHYPASTASSPARADGAKDGANVMRMEAHTKAMRLMHERMAATKTPEERAALMAEHAKTMREGMAMMNGMAHGGMGGMKGDMAMHHQTMEKRMEMMQAMMQMMMDRLPSAPGSK